MSDPIVIAGWVSAACLASCAFPQALQSVLVPRTGRPRMSLWFLWLWFIGEVAGLIYVAPQGDWPLIANYGVNMFLVGIILCWEAT